jgi:Protein of unknown function (DUF1552)
VSMKESLVGRRFFLRAAGVNLALPILDSLSSRTLGSGFGLSALAASASVARPTRMVCIGNAFGFHPPSFFPQRVGKDYDISTLLEPLAPHRQDFTLFSGLDHGTKGGHFGVHSYLSGVRSMEAKGMPEGNISIDQRAAETIRGATRFASLAVGSEDGLHGGCMMCWTRSGTRVPPIQSPRELFRKLFIDDSGADRDRTRDSSRREGSILDAVRSSADSLKNRLDKTDRTKLDEYFTSVRDVERDLELSSRWADIPKPKPGMKEPEDLGLVNDIPVLYDLIALALQTDSTRIATFEIAGGFEASVLGVKGDYHGLSHHGQVREKIELLVKLEKYQVQQFTRFLAKLKSIDDGGVPLLDRTMVLFGSGMGNANSHILTNLPIILAGGGFKHGEYKVFPPSGPGHAPLSNLYLVMLQRFGVETQKFALSSGTLRGLEA